MNCHPAIVLRSQRVRGYCSSICDLRHWISENRCNHPLDHISTKTSAHCHTWHQQPKPPHLELVCRTITLPTWISKLWKNSGLKLKIAMGCDLVGMSSRALAWWVKRRTWINELSLIQTRKLRGSSSPLAPSTPLSSRNQSLLLFCISSPSSANNHADLCWTLIGKCFGEGHLVHL